MSLQSLAGRVRARIASVVSTTIAKQAAVSASTLPPAAGRSPVRRAAARAVAEMLEGRQLLTGSPYSGAPVSLPGRVQVEDFDLGGEGVGYHDTTAGNVGGAYRTADRVDVEAVADAGGGYAVGTVAPGEWLNYTVTVAAAGSYDLSFRVAVPTGGGTFHLQNEAGANLTGSLTVPNTGAWGTYATVTKAGVALAAGTQTLRLSMDAYGTGSPARVGNFNWFAADPSPAPASIAAASQPGRVVVTWSAPPAGSPAVASYTLYRSTTPGGQGNVPYKTGLTAAGYADAAVAQGTTYYYTVAAVYAGGVGARSAEASAAPDTNRPFTGTPVALPGVLEFEDYDLGDEALAYHDTTPTNVSTATNYRPADAVDLSTTSDGTNLAIGAAVAGEWLKYTVDVPATGSYDLTFRLSAKVAGGKFHVEDTDGSDLTGPLAVPKTGDWLTYKDLFKSGVELSAGPHVLRLVLDANGAGQATVGNFDRVTVRPAAPRNVIVRPTSGTAARVTWAPINSATPLDGYTVRWLAPDGSVAQQTQVPATTTAVVAVGLTPNAQYQVDVQANFAGGGLSPAGLAPGGVAAQAAMPANNDTGWYQVLAPGDIAPGDAGYTNEGELHLKGPTGVVYAADMDQAAVSALAGSATVTSGPRAGTVSNFPDGAGFEIHGASGYIGYEDGWDGDNNDNDYNDGEFGLDVRPTDAPKVTIVKDTRVQEGFAAFLKVKRDKATDLPVTVTLALNGTARRNVDYAVDALTVTIPAGATDATFTVDTKDNLVVNKDRTVVVSLLNADNHHVIGGPAIATVTITDDDGAGGGIKPVPNKPPPRKDPPVDPIDDDYDPNDDATDDEADAWVDVSLGAYGWWYDDAYARKPDEQWYGSTDDGPGETTGGILQLNRDYDESYDFDEDGAPPTDLDTDEIRPDRDNDLAWLYLGAWTDDPSQDAAENSQWTLTWDESKVQVWLPQFGEDGDATGYARQSSGWSGSLADLENADQASHWWGGWGLWAYVEGIEASDDLDDVSFKATLAPADGDTVEDTVKATVTDLDLNIDSDNTAALDSSGKYGMPDASPEEDWLEDRPEEPGKILAVNDGDNDGDLVPDYADFDGVEAPDGSPAASFVPVVLTVPAFVDPGKATIQFSYAGSDPAEIDITGDGTSHDPYVYTLPNGRARLWTIDGDEVRDPSDLNDGGNYLAPYESYTLSDLGYDSESGTATVWLEAVTPSVDLADLRVTASLDIDGDDTPYSFGYGFGGSDLVQATSFTTRVVEVNADGTIGTEDKVTVTSPDPVFSNSLVTLNNVRLSADNSTILGDLLVTGSLDDEFLDLVPGADGQINAVTLFRNGETEALATITTSVTKATTPGNDNLLKPYDFSATFSTTVSGVELQPGRNTFELVAANGVGHSGSVSTWADVDVTTPEDHAYDFQIQLPNSGSSPGFPATLDLSYTVDGDATQGPITLSQISPGSNEYQWGTGQYKVVLNGDWTTPGTSTSATVSCRDLDLVSQTVRFDPSGPGTYLGSHEQSAADRDNYKDCLVVPGQNSGPASGVPSKVTMNAVEIVGPYKLADHLGKVTVGENGVKRDVAKFRHRLYVRDPFAPYFGDQDRPDVFGGYLDWRIVRPSSPGIRTPYQSTPRTTFADGLADGMVKPLIEIKETAYAIGDAAKKGAEWLYDHPEWLNPVDWPRLAGLKLYATIRDNQDTIIAGVRKASDLVNGSFGAIQSLIYDLVQRPTDQVVLDLIAGTHPAYLSLPPETHERLMMAAELLGDLWNRLTTFSDYDKGWYTGYALTTILMDVGIGLFTGGGGAAVTVVSKLSKLEFLQKIAPKLAKAGGVLAEAVEGLGVNITGQIVNDTSKLARSLKLTKCCFVPGTLVHTATGLVPIEAVTDGTLVWSRDEATGTWGYKPVTDTVVTHPDTLYEVTYDPDGAAGPLPAETIGASAPHPFYVSNRDGDGDGKMGGFVPADQLLVGDQLVLADGSSTWVGGISVKRAAPGDAFTTYNFTVAEFHTYFVGAAGVWVHNAGNRFCEKAYSVLRGARNIIKKGGLPAGTTQADAEFSVHLAAAKWAADHANLLTKEQVANLYAETFDDIYREGAKGWLNYFEGKSMPPRTSGKPWSSVHTIQEHVGRTYQDLLTRVTQPTFLKPMASTFTDLDAAESSLSFILTSERAKLIERAIAAKAGENFSKTIDIGRSIGYGVEKSGNTVSGLHNVNFNVIFDGRGGWSIQTAYPTV